MKKSIKFLPLLATGLLAVGCQDYDAGFTEADIKTKQYADKFVQEFGQVDPNQDWSMATLVEANVNLPELQGTAKMNIMTGDPRLSSTRLLAQIMLQDGQGQIQFDAIKGQNNVFVTIEQDGQYKVFGQYALVNGKLGVGDVADFLAAPSGVTRAFSDGCSTTQESTMREVTEIQVLDLENTITYSGKVWKLSQWVEDILANPGSYLGADWNSSPFTNESFIAYVKITGIDWSKTVIISDPNIVEYDESTGKYTLYYGGKDSNPGWNASKTLEEWKNDATASWNINNIPSGSYKGIWTAESLKEAAITESCAASDEGAIRVINQNWEEWVVDTTKGTVSPAIIHPNLQYLDNVDKEAAPAWTADLGYSFFGPGSFFEESVQYYSAGEGTNDNNKVQKLGKYYTEAEMLQMEEGYSITTKGGPIELPYIFGCTAFTNQFGYVYWKVEDENKPGFDPLKLKHFVLIEDARPSQNIYKETYGGTNVGNQELGTWDGKLSGQYLDGSEQAQQQYQEVANKSYVGTTYRVMYFGDDYNNTTGSYDWDEGYRIMFFIVSLANSELPDRIESRTGFIQKYFNYSIPAYNNRLYHTYQQAGKYPERKDFGLVKSIAWSRDGMTFLGFGDDSGDQDLNDIVFLVSGNFTNDVPPIKVAPIKWHMNLDGIHHDSDSQEVDETTGEPKYKKDDDLYFQESKNVGGTYSKPNGTPVRDGYEFKGWAKSPSATPSQVLSDSELTDVTVEDENGACYFAIWAPVGKSYTITWHNNYDPTVYSSDCGKDDPETDAADIHKQQVVGENERFAKPNTDPTAPSEKVFKGWSLTPTGDILSNEWFENPTNMTATGDDQNICFYAIYEDAPEPTPDPEYISWMFACEDLGGTFDYDFNDVVWEVQKTKVGEETTAVKVRLLAAGGTLPFTLSYNGTEICTKEEAFGTSTSPVNAGPGTVSKDVKEYNVSGIGSDWTVSGNYTKFSVAVEVEGTDASTMIQAYKKDETLNNKAPQVILVPGTWQWPTESTPIDEAYPQFTKWVENNNYVAWPTPVAGKTVTR